MTERNNKYYRFTYDDVGIYEAVRKCVDSNTWKNTLESPKVKWLPKPDIYEDNNRSYFTKKGYDMFIENVKPLFSKYIDFKQVKEEIVVELDNVIYEDEYQVITK